MNTFNRFAIYYGSITGGIFTVLVVLMAVDGGKLLQPIMLITLSLSFLLFVLMMSLLSYGLAKPEILSIEITDIDRFKNDLSVLANKCGRKTIVEKENEIAFQYSDKFRNWVATPMILKKKGNVYDILAPNVTLNEIKRLIINYN